jgi:hypothetical protein
MNIRRILGLVIVLAALVTVLPVPGYAADDAKANDWTIYLRPAIRFGTDDRTLFILDLLAPVYRGGNDVLFLNAKFTPDDHDAWETNAGIGYRRLLFSDRMVLGGNFFYDHRKTRRGNHFDQLGLGIEAMAEPGGIGLTARVNYYQPLTEAKIGEDFAYEFYGNGIFTAGIVEPLTGFDYEGGVRIPWVSDYVETWAYAGGYHFFGSHVEDVNGFSARLEAIPTDFVRLNFEYRNDNIDHNQYYGEVAFEVPFSIDNLLAGKNPFEEIGDLLTGSRSLRERMVEPVRRDVDIVVKEGALSPEEAASDGTMAAGAIFVADNAAPGGDGSFEHPYNSLWSANEDARLGNGISIVHVLRGDGSGLGSEGDFIFNQPGITIWGAGANNPAYPNVVNFVQGYPVLWSGIMMNGPNQTILGLYFDETGNAGITIGSGASGAGLNIFGNIIDEPGAYGIVYGNPGDLGAPGAPARIWGNTITDVGDEVFDSAGIYLNSYIGSVYANVYNNRVEEVYNEDPAYGIFVKAGDGDFDGSITGNTISYIGSREEAAGIYVEASDDFNGLISGNSISGIEAFDNFGVSAYGISAISGGNFDGSISGNKISDIWAGEAFWAEAYGIYAGTEDGDFAASINENTISGVSAEYADEFVGAAGIYAYADGSFSGSIAGNTVDDIWAGDTGGDAEASGISAWAGENFTGPIRNNTVSHIWAGGADEDAFALGIFGEASNDYSGDIFGNTVTDIAAEDTWGNAFAAGIAINPYAWWYDEDASTVTGSIHNNTVGGVFAGDVEYYAYAVGILGWSGFSDYLGSISTNTISGVSSTEMYWGVAEGIDLGASNFLGSVSNNTITGVSNDDYDALGINVYAFDTLTGSISGNTVSGVGGHDSAYGIRARGDDLAGLIENNTLTGITAVDSAATGIYLWSDEGIFTSVRNNVLKVASGGTTYGLYAASLATLGSNLLPMVFTGNSGTLNGTAVYAAWLETSDPGASYVFTGFGTMGMGENDFTTAGAWAGNYPYAGGPIWASGYPGINFIHP